MTGATSIRPQPPWPRARIEALLRSEDFTYQAIELPYGLRTEGHDRSITARAILPATLNGESLLDVGSALGFFCFEARRRGAGRVVGLDVDPDHVRKARLLAEILGLSVEFRAGDLERQDIGERFDHVLCLNVLHHLADPIHGLDRLIAATRRRLVLEVATPGRHDRRRLGMSWLTQRLLSRVPALVVGRGTAAAGVSQFYFTPGAVENLLRYRRGLFARIEILPSEFKDRFLVIAHRRQIGHLLVIAGPTSSGQHDVLRRLGAGALPAIAGLEPGELSRFGPPLRADDYHRPRAANEDRLAFLYDIDRPWTTGAGSFARDPALEVLDTAARTTILTVWRSPDELRRRIEGDVAAARGRARTRLMRLRDRYADPRKVVEQYRAWVRYAGGRNAGHRVVHVSREACAVLSAEQWDGSIATPLLSAG